MSSNNLTFQFIFLIYQNSKSKNGFVFVEPLGPIVHAVTRMQINFDGLIDDFARNKARKASLRLQL
jgi:hypothetical protein